MQNNEDILGLRRSLRTGGPEKVVAAGVLSEWINLSEVRIHRLGRDGVLPRTPEKKFPLKPSIRAYAEYLRKGQIGRASTNPDLNAEKLRLAREQADKLAIANAATRGEMVALSDVEREWIALAIDLRARLLAVSPRVASALGLDRAIAARIDSELRDCLEGIADDD